MGSSTHESRKVLPLWTHVQLYLDSSKGYPMTLSSHQRRPGNIRLAISSCIDPAEGEDRIDPLQVYVKNLRQPPHGTTSQGIDGVAFTESDILTFSVETKEVKNLVLSVLLTESVAASGPWEPFAQGFLTGAALSGSSGRQEVPLFDPAHRHWLGHLSVGYLVIKPRPFSVQQGLKKATQFRVETSLHIGHRGSGATFSDSARSNYSVTENTLRSFIAAAHKNADFIEFDVSLTKDHVPVIYHDFHVGVKACTHDGSSAIVTVPVCRLSAKELKQCVMIPESVIEKCEARLSRTALDNEESLFPTLEEALQKAPPSLGFVVEVKYPQMLLDDTHECEEMLDENIFVDRILDVVFEHANTRNIIFCCFEPRITVLLKAKQADFPVFFLTCGINDQYTPYLDMRTRDVDTAVAFALSEDLQGVSVFINPLEREVKTTFDQVKSAGLHLLTWGTKNNDASLAAFQRQLGVHGVILDSL